MRILSTFIPLLVLATFAAPQTQAQDKGPVEAVVREFFAGIERGDVDGLRSLVTADFEIIDGGTRMNMAQFEDMLGGVAEEGIELSFILSEFNTEIAGDVAYTSLRSEDPGRGLVFFETATLRRVDGRWMLDRFTSTPRREPPLESD